MTEDTPNPNTFDRELDDDRERSDALGKAIDKAEDKLKSHQPKPDRPTGGGLI